MQLIETAVSGNTIALIDMLSACARQSAPWPVASATLLFAAVKTQQREVANMMLSMGAPAHLACRQLVPGDQAALAAAGISVDGASHLCPLTVAVRQQNLDMCRLLLSYGAPASRSADGLPVLLHFLDAIACAGGPAPSAGPGSTTSGGGGDGTSSRGTASRAATPGGSMPSRSLSRPSRGTGPDDLAAYLQSLENQLQMLHLLLAGGSCPLERPRHSPTDSRCFLSGVCRRTFRVQ